MATPRTLFVLLFLLAILKLILSSHEEMRGLLAPHDDFWQVSAAARTYWEGAYGPNHLYRLPIYPLFIKWVSSTGIPFRIVLELAYCAGASFLALALWRVGIPGAVAALAAAAAILHPASFQVPNRFCAEILLAPLLMASLAGTLEWWVLRGRNDSWKWACVAAFFWSLSWNIRSESIVLVPIFATLGLCLWFTDRAEGWKNLYSRVMMGIGLPLLACVVLATAIKVENYHRWGLYASTAITAPGFKAMFKALQKIRPTHPVDYMLVTAEARQRAYEISPAFKKLQPHLDTVTGEGWTKVSKQWTDSKGMGKLDPHEIAAGWFYWALYEAAVAARRGSSPAEMDEYFATIAKEINAAIADGRLPSRFVPITMVDPDISRWAPRLGASLRAVYEACVTQKQGQRESVNDPFLPQKYADLYNSLANRRAYLIDLGPGRVTGWIQSPSDSVASFGLRCADGSPVDALLTTKPRPDVGPSTLGFHFSVPEEMKKNWKAISLVVWLKNGGEIEFPIQQVNPGKTEHRESNAQWVEIAFEQLKAPVPSEGWNRQFRWACRYFALVRWLQWPALIGLVVALVSSMFGRKTPEFPVVALLATAVGARVGLFTILDASAWPGDEPRYLFAIMPLGGMLLVLGIWLLAGAIQKKRSRALGS